MTRIIFVILGVLLASCAEKAPFVDPSREIQLYGLSSPPPQNGNWIIFTLSGNKVSFGKKGENQNENHNVNVYLYKIPKFLTDSEFFNYIEKKRAAKIDTKRYEIIENKQKYEILNGAKCISYHLIAKDSSDEIKKDREKTIFLENNGYHCIHLKDLNVGVQMEYLFHHDADTTYTSVVEDAKSFFNNIKFTESTKMQLH